ncbi:hypothetical protein [Streptomyces sp. 2A115]|uniref:hypothetical protein n=1 Tax=Streptomyces sp. 2A115 TaxID=3457439 RepID=UPI003FD319FA
MSDLFRQARRAFEYVLASWPRALRLAFLLAVGAVVIYFVGPQICDVIEATSKSLVTDVAEAYVKIHDAHHRSSSR